MSSCLILSIFVFYWNFLQHLNFFLSIVNVYIFVFVFSLAILTTCKFFFSISYWLMLIFFKIQFSSVQSLCRVWLFATPWTAARQAADGPCPSPIPGVYSNSCPLSQWCIQPSHPLLSPSPPTFNLSQHQGLFKWDSFSNRVTKVLEYQLQH